MLPSDTLQDTVDILGTVMALGMPVPVIVGMQGWVLTIDPWDNDGSVFRAHTTVHQTAEDAECELANWVIEWWSNYFLDSDWDGLEEEQFLPLKNRTDKEIIDKHFESEGNRDMYSIVFFNVAPVPPRR